jgi:ATP-binding cassette subfamily B protein
VQRGEAAMQRILEIWREAPEIQDGGRALVGRPRGELRFERVTFAYAGGPPVLRDIDLVVPAGSTLAIVGRTGAGKSSLVRLLPRLYDPTAGRVLLDGVDLREYRLRELRSAIGMVPQDPFLFSDTLAANLRFGRQEATDAEVLAAAATAGLEPDLETFSRGIRTRVGERGLTLSGGQRQRATLARALLANPAVLSLDDALASVDKSTEAELLVRLRAAARGRTVILIAHRLSTIRDADRIVVLEEGRIVESGRHDELLPRGGLYAELARRQALAEALEDSDAPR